MTSKYASAVTEEKVQALLDAVLSGKKVTTVTRYDDAGAVKSKTVSETIEPKSAAAALKFADSITGGQIGVFDAAAQVGDVIHIMRPKRLPTDPFRAHVVSNAAEAPVREEDEEASGIT